VVEPKRAPAEFDVAIGTPRDPVAVLSCISLEGLEKGFAARWGSNWGRTRRLQSLDQIVLPKIPNN
jgi:hypothetical protein